MSDTCFVSSCENEWPHLHIMPLEEMMSKQSAEIDPASWFNWDGYYIEGDYSHRKHKSYLAYKRDEQYRAIKQSIKKHGFWPGFAPEIIDGVIEEGHHRITAFHDMGVYWIPWQDTFNYDQYEDNWEHYVYGRTEPVDA